MVSLLNFEDETDSWLAKGSLKKSERVFNLNENSSFSLLITFRISLHCTESVRAGLRIFYEFVNYLMPIWVHSASLLWKIWDHSFGRSFIHMLFFHQSFHSPTTPSCAYILVLFREMVCIIKIYPKFK